MLAPKRMDALWEDLLIELDKTIYVYRLTSEEADAVIELYKAAQKALAELKAIRDDVIDLTYHPVDETIDALCKILGEIE